MESITEETYSIEQLDAIANELEPFTIDVDSIPTGSFLLGTISKIVPVATAVYGARLDYFGKLIDGKKFRASSWGCKTTLKPSDLLGAKLLKFSNPKNKKIVIDYGLITDMS